jgi:hypothetical protein
MTRTSRSMMLAMLCAAAVTAELVGGKATRDALFLTSLDVTALPAMLIAASLCSILLVAVHARGASRIPPAALVPASFALSAVLFLGEWLFRSSAPSAVAVLVYLHVSAAGPLLASSFWLVASERFDPRTAKRRFGPIAGAGTLGGLLGALVSERVAALMGAPSMLLFLALFQLAAAVLIRVLASGSDSALPTPSTAVDDSRSPARSGLRVVAEAPHLRRLMALVLFGTTSAALLDYLFKVRAVETFGPGDGLLRFFALYYAVISIVSFVLQTLGSRPALERFGLALTTSTPSIALLAGSIVNLIAPGFGSLVVARGGESIFRGSWFRAGYELLFTPLPADEKRAAKSVIDVGVDRLGEAIGGGLIRLAIVFGAVAQSSAILSMAIASSIAAIVAASQLNRWYLRTLEKSLVRMGGRIDPPGATSDLTRRATAGTQLGTPAGNLLTRMAVDPIVQDILALRSGDRERALEILSRSDRLPGVLVSHVIPLLASGSIAEPAQLALRRVAAEHAGELVDALLDSNQPAAVRRRLARVLSTAASQRAADGLVLALDDPQLDVRLQAGRSLASIKEKNPQIGVPRERIEQQVLREAAVSGPSWARRRQPEEIRQDLAHVFTLLSLVLPTAPLQIAFKGLQSSDRRLQGTAIEYLEGVLPGAIRSVLWPFILAARTRPQPRPAPALLDLVRTAGKSRTAGFATA